MRRSFASLLLLGVGAWGPLSAQAAPRWTLAPDIRIGSFAPSYQFSAVNQLALAPDGGVYVLDLGEALTSTIRLYDRAGKFVRRVVGPGQRPGEFNAADGVFMGAIGDTLWIINPAAGRAFLFPRDTGLVRSLQLSLAAWLLSDGSAIGATGRVCQPGRAQADSARVRHMTRDGRVLNEVTALWVGPCPVAVGVQGGQISVEPPVDETPLWTAQPGGATIVVVDRRAPGGADAFRVRRLRANGDVMFSSVFPYRPLPLTRAMQDTIAARIFADAGAAGAPWIAAARAHMTFPASMPTVTRLIVGVDGSTWVRREEYDKTRHNLWTVIGPRGELAGEVMVPDGFVPAAADASSLWGIEVTPPGLVSVVRMRIQGRTR